MGIDLNAVKDVADRENEGTLIHLNDELGKPWYEGERKVTITVAGSYSRIFRKAEEAIRRRPLKAGKLTSEKFYDENMEKAIACTLAWEGFELDGKPADLSRANIAKLYTNCPWVYDQVWEAMNDHQLFFRNDSEN
jgi:hypothetical protein